MSVRMRKRLYPALAAVTGLGVVTALVIVSPASPAFAATELPVSGVSASEDDGHVPQNTVDGDLGTRWSAEGDPEWIQFDLGQSRTVESVRVAWYRGDERQSSFDVQTSANASSWTTVHSGSSSGTTTALEDYNVTDTAGRYVRIVGHGNTSNDWNSITEVKILGSDGNPPTSSSSTTTTTQPPVGTDPNGVRQLYPSRVGKAEPWTLGFGDWQARFDIDGGTFTGFGKDIVINNDGDRRMDVFATVETIDCDGKTNYAESLAQGYACSPNDWNNIEMTGYVRLVSGSSTSTDQDWTWYGPSGKHTDKDQYPGKCWGHAYKASYHYRNGDVRFGKEMWHVNYDYDGPSPNWVHLSNGIDYGEHPDKWLGMKFVRYEFTENGKRGIRNELWLDFSGIDAQGNPANNWGTEPVLVVEDHPDGTSWGDGATDCHAVDDDQILLWGDPRATFRWDDTESELRLASVREIVPPTP